MTLPPNDDMQDYFCNSALLPDGWATDVRLRIDARGYITEVATDAGPNADSILLAGPVIPGIPNVHSHAFQFAMAGLTERQSSKRDSFWSWRDTMYQFVDRLAAEDIEAIAAQLFLDCLKQGYTSIAEFHYLHHQVGGQPYDEPGELARRHINAAKRIGIGLTILPVLYTYGGLDERPLSGGQRRFYHSTGDYMRLLSDLHTQYPEDPTVRVGFAAHSLRAVTLDQLEDVYGQIQALDPTMPCHIHIAEQQAEVEDCMARHGTRPVETLMHRMGSHIDSHWCLIHATHMTPDETQAVAASGAVCGLCPTTEANLGDGIFPLPSYAASGGAFAIGSDSHIRVSPWAELRLLEYAQRLQTEERNVMATDERSTGSTLLAAVMQGGRLACGRPIGRLAVGSRGDFLVLDDSQPGLIGRSQQSLVDSLVFCGDTRMIRDVWVAGKPVIQSGRHVEEDTVTETFRQRIGPLITSICNSIATG